MSGKFVFHTLLAIVVLVSGSSRVVAQDASTDGEEKTLTTRDGWAIPINYYPTKGGPDSPVIIMFSGPEGKDNSRTRKAWTSAALALQKKGFAVVTADLRKHGDSAHVSGKTPSSKMLSTDYQLMATQDLEVIKGFLLKEHEGQKLNIRKLGIATTGSGCMVSAGFASVDWNKKPWPDAASFAMRTPKGQDVRALFWMGPVSTVRGINTSNIMKSVGAPQKGIAAQIWYNPSEKKEKESAERLWKYLDPKNENYESVRSLNAGPAGPAAQFSAEASLEGRAGKVMEGHMVKFFYDNLKKLEFPWKTRKSRL